MNNKDMMYKFIKCIECSKLLTKFIKDIFDYEYLEEYNYIFRMINNDDEIIIDIYDNVSDTRFNRYIFDFNDNEYVILDDIKDDVMVRKISVLNAYNNCDKLLKIAYLFKLRDEFMIKYASSFLDGVFVEIISDIIK